MDQQDSNSNVSLKRKDYLEWHSYFMGLAFLTAKRSKDPVTQVGACIVNRENKIVGIGYNGMPLGCNDDEFPWGKHSESRLNNKYLYVCHAEMNAVLNKNASDLKNCTIYTVLFPCNECAKVIIQSGISEVIYVSHKYETDIETIAAKRMFNAAGVKYWQYVPKEDPLIINFNNDKLDTTEACSANAKKPNK